MLQLHSFHLNDHDNKYVVTVKAAAGIAGVQARFSM